MSETNPDPNNPMRHTFPDMKGLVPPHPPDAGDGTDEYGDVYDGWAELDEAEPFPREFELREAAQQRKAGLDGKMDELLARLASDEVRGKAHYGPGGEAEVVAQMRALQLEELPKVYADVRYESDYLAWHTPQETESWCQLASLQNAFRALGDESVTQEDIAQTLHLNRLSPPFPSQLMDFAREKGLVVQEMDSVTDMVDALVAGSKVVLQTGYPAAPSQHTILVSGVRVDHGAIEFIYNDPATDNGDKSVSLGRMLELLEPPLAHNETNRSYALSKGQA
ncbi:MAG: Papain-like cysteine protease AvrRpt2 [Patescibacteria group bacterium]|jgi:hypothetical protein|nr:Papain-like cysteine protease AvrRpt2 [Patescibacteria group bacterium]